MCDICKADRLAAEQSEREVYELEMESIYMAWTVGANYPEEKLHEAILYMNSRG